MAGGVAARYEYEGMQVPPSPHHLDTKRTSRAPSDALSVAIKRRMFLSARMPNISMGFVRSYALNELMLVSIALIPRSYLR